eukprot:Seg3649.2 transcript_id=Seg3649.2/GoldUCD/mRNA.D3Y31 product="hypothetical protein" protein_id=Seg3649.2/GoldUCD/D3Y31
MKAQAANRNNADSGEKSCSAEPNFEQLFIKNLQDRIISLERQLNQKQQIIDKLLEERGKHIEVPPLQSSDTRVRPLENRSGSSAPEQFEKTQPWKNSRNSPFQTPDISATVGSGFQRVENRFEPVRWGLHDTQQVPEKSFEPVKNGKSTRNRPLPSNAIPIQNRFSALSDETEENQLSNSENNEEFHTTSKNGDGQRRVITDRSTTSNKGPGKQQTTKGHERNEENTRGAGKKESNKRRGITIIGDSIVKNLDAH